MKYIRTKDNVYEIVNDYGSSCAVKSRGKRGKTAIDGFTIKYGLSYAPRADAIKDLCDEFVIIKENRCLGQFKANQMANEEATTFEFVRDNHLRFHDDTVYAAIWTDKGLIYVAKMNDKGELELL